MTSIDFLNKVHKRLDSQEYNLSYSPAKSKNYMLYCNSGTPLWRRSTAARQRDKGATT